MSFAMKQNMPEAAATRACPVCGSGSTAFFTEKNGYSFLKCGDCDLVFIHPELPQQSLVALYSEQGAPKEGSRYPYDKAKKRRQLSLERMRRFQDLFKDKDCIDVGCGGGYIVDAMQKLGGRAVGIDLDPEAIAFGKANHHPEAKFYNEPVDKFAERGLKFDFGHSAQVIEHVGDFHGFVEGWNKVLKPGAYFFLKTPDRNHWRTGKDPQTWPNPPHYTQYFSRRNIPILLEKHGFEVQKIYFCFKPSMEILMRKE
jgi:SAM-dependent methyltransferase